MEIGKLNNLIYMIVVFVLLLFILLGYRKKIKIAETLKIKISKIKYIKEILLLTGVALIIFSLTEPKKETGVEKIEREGVDLYFLIDISKSMMCSDVKPTRLERSKESIRRIISSLDGDRVGFIPFSSASYIQMPLTDDYDMARTFLEMMDSTLISGGGTNIKSAIEMADSAFENSKSSEKVIMIFSDGEEQEESEFKKEKDNKKKIYCTAVGTETGAAVPELDEAGNQQGFKTDDSGNPIISKVTNTSLTQIAENYGGKVYKIDMLTDDTDKIITDMKKMNEGKIKEEEKKTYRQYYQFFLGTGILFLLLGYLGFGIKIKK